MSAISFNIEVLQYREKSNNLSRRQISKSWQYKIKMADNAGQFIKTIFIVLFFKQKHFNIALWVLNKIRRIIESGTIS